MIIYDQKLLIIFNISNQLFNNLLIKMISKDNYTCPICLGIFIDPCKLPCNHIFCLPCLLELVDFNFIQYKCPMCRNEFMNNNGPFKID